MQETIPREFATHPEPFTGERLTASVHGQVELEHYHRYLFARSFCRERDVLDVASGEGYGAAQLAQVANRVVGIEYAGATARSASENFPRGNLHFVQADARLLPLAAGSVDVVTSFETIEHFDRQDEFVAEVHRVLRRDGCFIVSTPDRAVYSPPGTPPNPYHVREFDRYEFLDLLHGHFHYVSLIRQRPMVASLLVPEEPSSVMPQILERGEGEAFLSDAVLPNAPYLIAIASNQAPAVAPVSMMIAHSDIDGVRSSDKDAELTLLRVSEAAAREEVEAARKRAEQFENDAQAAKVTLNHTRAALVQANTDLDRISGSIWHFLLNYVPRIWRLISR